MIQTPTVLDRYSTQSPLPGALAAAPQGSFGAILRQAAFDLPAEESRDIRASKADEVREAAKGLIASAFLVPMLASIRENSFAAGPYAPTTVERRFGPLIDQHIADRVMSGTNFALVDSIVNRTLRTDADA